MGPMDQVRLDSYEERIILASLSTCWGDRRSSEGEPNSQHNLSQTLKDLSSFSN